MKIIGGSDAHFPNEIGRVYTIMKLDKKGNFIVEDVIGNGSYFNLFEFVKTKIKKILN